MLAFRFRSIRAFVLLLACCWGLTATAHGQSESLTQDDFNKSILELYQNKELTFPDSYKRLLELSDRLFEHQHRAEIESSFGDQATSINAWFSEHPEIKNELYTAIDPAVDDVNEALKIFRTLFETFPEKIEAYSELAIATAVVWDKTRAIYEWVKHALHDK